jgi:predicted RNA-binding protein with PIN domain
VEFKSSTPRPAKLPIPVATSDHLEQQTVISFGALAITAEHLRPILAEAATDLTRRLKPFKRK